MAAWRGHGEGVSVTNAQARARAWEERVSSVVPHFSERLLEKSAAELMMGCWYI